METLGLKPVTPPNSPLCVCLGPRRWEFFKACDGVGCRQFKQDYSANYLTEHTHYRCLNCNRTVATAMRWPDID